MVNVRHNEKKFYLYISSSDRPFYLKFGELDTIRKRDGRTDRQTPADS